MFYLNLLVNIRFVIISKQSIYWLAYCTLNLKIIKKALSNSSFDSLTCWSWIAFQSLWSAVHSWEMFWPTSPTLSISPVIPRQGSIGSSASKMPRNKSVGGNLWIRIWIFYGRIWIEHDVYNYWLNRAISSWSLQRGLSFHSQTRLMQSKEHWDLRRNMSVDSNISKTTHGWFKLIETFWK